MTVEEMREGKRKTKIEENGNEVRRWELHEKLNWENTVNNG